MKRVRVWCLVLAGAPVMLVAACGSPTAEPPRAGQPAGADSGQGGAGSGSAVEPVLAKVDDLDGEPRRQRLVELARDAGPISLYTSNTDAEELTEAFTDQYGIDVSVYRANGDVVLQRLVQEAQAGFHGADVVEMDMLRMVALGRDRGLLAPYEGPAVADLPDNARFPTWTATRLNVFVTGQNTEVLPLDRRPSSYQELADPAYDGAMMMEPRAAEWFVTLYRYFEKQGMKPEDIEDMFTRMASNATVVRGNSVQAEMLAAGEYGLAASTYSHAIDELAGDGAPVVWRPPLEPVVVRPNGIGMTTTANNPAGAVLLYEWFLTDAQPLIAELGRVPSRPDAQRGVLDGLETINVAADDMITDGERWERLYEKVLRGAAPDPNQ